MSSDDAYVVVVGSHAPGLRVDVEALPLPGETVIGQRMSWPPDGGKGSNQAIAAAKLGGDVAFVGCVGADDLGDTAVRLLADNGVDVRHLVRSQARETGCGVNIIDAKGIPVMVTVPGANAELTSGHVSAAFETYQHPRVLLTQLEIEPTVALHAVRVAKAREAVTVLNAAPAIASLSVTALAESPIDILIVNEVEAALIAGASAPVDDSDEPELLARLQATIGSDTVIMTLGARGVLLRHNGRDLRLNAADVEAVDTSGAGDVFCGALAVRLAQGASLDDACAWANVAAALSVTKEGTIPAFPNASDLHVGAVRSTQSLPASKASGGFTR